MQDISNVSSEEELLQLRNEGKISEDEYQQLLAAMSKSPHDEFGPSATGPPVIPSALRIVAWLFIIGGILAVIEVLVALTQSRISINFGVLGLFIGPGLLRLRRGWRTCALVFLWIGLIVFPLIFLLGLSGTIPAYFEVFGIKMARIPSWWVSVGTIPFFLLVFWQYRVLTRPQIRTLFGLDRW